jgi:hypothetical protein
VEAGGWSWPADAPQPILNPYGTSGEVSFKAGATPTYLASSAAGGVTSSASRFAGILASQGLSEQIVMGFAVVVVTTMVMAH